MAASALRSRSPASCLAGTSAPSSRKPVSSVCVRLEHVSQAVKELQGTPVAVACVIGFHEGTSSTDDKVAETRSAVCQGARELDMVMNYPWLQAGRYQDVYADIVAVRQAAAAVAASDGPVTLKVILETSQLSRDQIVAGCVVVCLAEADFVKTSTGFNGAGASVENVALMRAVVENLQKGVKVKASGGVRTAEDCIMMLRAGAERIGTSAGVKIVSELESQGSGVTVRDY